MKYNEPVNNSIIEALANIQCPLCFKYVSELKSGCHVIPRWQSILTKENGKYLEISSDKVGPGQSDIKTKSWCDSCEAEFAVLDGVGACFFRDNFVFSEKVEERVNIYRFRDLDTYYKVKKFIGSIIVRHYLYALSNDKPIRQSESFLNEFYKAYLKKEDICIILHDMRKFFLNASSIPAISQDSIQIMINGCLAVLTLDSRPLGDAPISSGELLLYNVTDPELPYVKNFLKILRSLNLKIKQFEDVPK